MNKPGLLTRFREKVDNFINNENPPPKNSPRAYPVAGYLLMTFSCTAYLFSTSYLFSDGKIENPLLAVVSLILAFGTTYITLRLWPIIIKPKIVEPVANFCSREIQLYDDKKHFNRVMASLIVSFISFISAFGAIQSLCPSAIAPGSDIGGIVFLGLMILPACISSIFFGWKNALRGYVLGVALWVMLGLLTLAVLGIKLWWNSED